VAVVVSFVLSKWLAGPPAAPQVPEPEEAAVPPQVRLPRRGPETAANLGHVRRSGSLSGGPVALASSGELL
jgi:hypothetical protein